MTVGSHRFLLEKTPVDKNGSIDGEGENEENKVNPYAFIFVAERHELCALSTNGVLQLNECAFPAQVDPKIAYARIKYLMTHHEVPASPDLLLEDVLEMSGSDYDDDEDDGII